MPSGIADQAGISLVNEVSDEALMLSYAKGDVQAFESLYARYRESLYRYFLRHVSDATTANDLYQGCWEKVIGARQRYREQSPFRAWLFRIAHNHLVDHYRARRETQALPPELEDPNPDSAADSLDEDARLHRFRSAIATLPPEQRDTFLLRMESGLSLEQLAAATGVTPETAKSRLRYATRKLKEVLQV